MKKVFLVTSMVLILLASACATKNNIKACDSQIYYNLELYDGASSACKIDGELCIPTDAVELKGQGFVPSGEDTEYIKYSDLNNMPEYDCLMSGKRGKETIYIKKKRYFFDYAWTENGLIAHALGGINGYGYTNSLEAFTENYRLGHRIFEVDFLLTSDGKMVCAHSFENDEPIDYETFMSGTHWGFTRIDVNDIISFLKDYPDIYIITDSKETDAEPVALEFCQLLSAANEAGCPDVLDRIVPQIYNNEMFDVIMGIYEWKSMIYTSYLIPDETYSEEELIRFAYMNDIKVITMAKDKYNEEYLARLNELGFIPYIHTFNTKKEQKYYLSRGYKGVYTDFITP